MKFFGSLCSKSQLDYWSNPDLEPKSKDNFFNIVEKIEYVIRYPEF